MPHSKILIAGLAAATLVGCSVDPPWQTKPKTADHFIAYETLPPDPDREASAKKAKEFLGSLGDDGSMYWLRSSVVRVFGDWEKGGYRAFVATTLVGSQATPENGRLITNAFANWTNSEDGQARVSVYDTNGKLLYTGSF